MLEISNIRKYNKFPRKENFLSVKKTLQKLNCSSKNLIPLRNSPLPI